MDPQIAARREKCKTDPFYLAQCLGYDFQPDVHGPLFDTLLKFRPNVALRDQSEVKNRLILWPRGHYKTSAVVLHIVQTILNYPDVRLLIMQANQRLGSKQLKEIKSHFLTPGAKGANTKSVLPILFPEFCAPVLGNSMEFTVPARTRMHLPAATVTVASPRAAQTGQHYDAFFPDDLVNQNNYRNIELLDQLLQDFDLFVPLIDPGGYTTMTGTRYHHADLYGRMIQRNAVAKQHGQPEPWVISHMTVSLTGKWPVAQDQELLFPVREVDGGTRKIGFTVELLKQIERDNPEMFWAQYMNQIVIGRKQKFPESLILASMRSEKDAAFPANSPTVFQLDLAESKRKDSDHSIIAAGKRSGNAVWITDCVGSTFSTYELIIVLINLTLKHRPIAILVPREPGSQHFITAAEAVAREKGVRLPFKLAEKASRHKDAKEIRIEALEGRFRNNQLFLLAGIPDFQRLMDEFTQFPKGEHDDRPDAIAMLVEFFSQGFTTQIAGPRLPWFVTQESPQNPFADEPSGSDLLGGVLIN